MQFLGARKAGRLARMSCLSPHGLRAAAPARASPGCDRALLLAVSVRRLRLRLRLLLLRLLLLPLLPLLLLLLRLGLRRMLSHLRRLATT